MPSEASTVQILEAIQTVAESVAESIQSLATHMDERFNEHDRRFESIEARMATKDNLQEFKEEILSHVDWFAAQHNRYDTELLSLRSSSLRHEERITTLEKKIA